MILLGRDGGEGPTGHLGACLARDGSAGARVEVDMDRPHAGVVVGKRGYGKSYTLGVLAEELAAARGPAPVVVDPMGAFESLAVGMSGARYVASPTVRATAVPPRAWPAMLDLSPTSGAGGLVWRAAAETVTLAGMREHVRASDADRTTRRAAENHLRLAASWGVFDPDGLASGDLVASPATVLDCSGLAAPPANAVVRAVASGLYEACVDRSVDRLPWLLVDEAHAFFDGGRGGAPASGGSATTGSSAGAIAAPALETVLTRGRAPGVSLVLATQRPAALPAVAVSQADLLVAHRLTAEPDLDALERVRPAYATRGLVERVPDATGEALVVDDATEAVHAVTVRERETSHDGGDARASVRPVAGETSTDRGAPQG
ncbi:ATPase [Halobacteriales archaeon QS_1_68_20]|nr:MAG: ATPase [Halobacteriales archaeon QS_1_68_20]